MALASPYDILGVAPDATDAEIRRAYHRLARRWHPDFHAARAQAERDRAARRMQEINEAWHTVGDPLRRRAHDRGEHGASGTTGTGPVRVRAEAAAARSPANRGPASYDDEFGEATAETWIDGDGEGRPPRGGRLLVVPGALVALSIGLAVLSMVVPLPFLFPASMLSLVAGIVAFLVAPLVVMVDARKTG